jgi:hypothetical protein
MNREIAWLSTIITLGVTYFIFTAYKSGALLLIIEIIFTSWWFWGGIIGLFLISILFETYKQKNLSNITKVILNDIEANRALTNDFVLYLRPFTLTGKINKPAETDYIETTKEIWLQYHRTSEDMDFQLEECVIAAFENQYFVLGLGEEAAAHGVGVVPVDFDVWRAEITTLAKHAKVIFIIPGYQDGTFWELKYILENKLLHKTILFMPPQNQGSKKLSEFWTMTRLRVWTELEFQLPLFDSTGRILCYNNDKELIFNRPLDYDMNRNKFLFRSAADRTFSKKAENSNSAWKDYIKAHEQLKHSHSSNSETSSNLSDPSEENQGNDKN